MLSIPSRVHGNATTDKRFILDSTNHVYRLQLEALFWREEENGEVYSMNRPTCYGTYWLQPQGGTEEGTAILNLDNTFYMHTDYDYYALFDIRGDRNNITIELLNPEQKLIWGTKLNLKHTSHGDARWFYRECEICLPPVYVDTIHNKYYIPKYQTINTVAMLPNTHPTPPYTQDKTEAEEVHSSEFKCIGVVDKTNPEKVIVVGPRQSNIEVDNLQLPESDYPYYYVHYTQLATDNHPTKFYWGPADSLFTEGATAQRINPETGLYINVPDRDTPARTYTTLDSVNSRIIHTTFDYAEYFGRDYLRFITPKDFQNITRVPKTDTDENQENTQEPSS